MYHIRKEWLENALSYSQYRNLINDLLDKNQTTGNDQSQAMVDYTRMNVQRMRRNEKQTVLTPALLEKIDAIKSPLYWLVITEAWCGDAAQNIPALAKIAESSPFITMGLVLRDEHPELMDQFLTNGTRSIPKLVVIDPVDLQVLGHWGPRPQAAQKIVVEAKAAGIAHDIFAEMVHKWYAQNKSQDLMAELLPLFDLWQAAR
jgi:hypothetical protein